MSLNPIDISRLFLVPEIFVDPAIHHFKSSSSRVEICSNCLALNASKKAFVWSLKISTSDMGRSLPCRANLVSAWVQGPVETYRRVRGVGPIQIHIGHRIQWYGGPPSGLRKPSAARVRRCTASIASE